MKKIAINGFGRIGRLAFRALLNNKEVEVVAINDLTDNKTLAHLLKYDSAHGVFGKEVSYDDNHLYVDGKEIAATAIKDPSTLPWKELNVDVVLECTGIFRDTGGASAHIKAGATKVLISAPAKGEMKTIVLGVNDDTLTSEDDIVSNASCTTNCLAPMVKVLHENFGIENGYMCTIHAYTGDQNIHDAPHSDLRRSRAAAVNMIPTSTGAAGAISLVIPEMAGKLRGNAVRVPVITGSLTQLYANLGKAATSDEINACMKKAAENELKGVLQYTEDPLVSSDIIGNKYSCIFDSLVTNSQGTFISVAGWYDNEAGYATRLAELTLKVCDLSK